MKTIKLLFLLLLITTGITAQSNKNLAVIAYYTGDDKQINEFEVNKLTHIIYSFCHLKDGKLSVDTAKDSLTIKHLVSLKAKNPQLKIMLSLGGWGGCETCSDVFSTPKGREDFAKSVKEVNAYFNCDGLDLDWEYPTIEGFPEHHYQEADKKNFTELIKILRQTLGNKNELSFASGGFQKYLDESVEWKKIMPLVDRVNIMSYDLVNGYSKVTGHHTPLFSTKKDEESTDKAVTYLLKLGIPAKKIVIGAAFYTRVWKEVSNSNNGLYQSGIPTAGVNFKEYTTSFTTANGWNYFWDQKAMAAYWYNEKEKLFATGDDIPSVKAKTTYVIKNKLGGIMFWELVLDSPRNGMVDAIYQIKIAK
ncbi:glycoside hydrolase family 18 protein [Flavobacterium sp. ZT3R18]|uniref:glycoside hydrolase family 18 protein n=1 Tax=Flavobacterium sp. ZT3R18 TaxID=2594429 RepID=UPI00117B732D|nr:glycoside hydrolase family 18 protein [Flavobacterium sp. ZT3R18]TRX36577.1 glycoside hydrolase family 18 protein [Flavobacterium sp. ZT3R18]